MMSRQNAVLSSATQHTMPPEFDGKWATECQLNTRLPLSIYKNNQKLNIFVNTKYLCEIYELGISYN